MPMKFLELVGRVRAWLEQESRVSYRALKREFDLSDEDVEDLRAELIDAKRLAVDEDGKVLVWVGKGINGETDKRGKGEDSLESSVQRLASKDQPPTPSPQSLAARSKAERRQLTVMFCDLVGSTALSAQLDPEELRNVVRAYQQASATVIERFGGHIAQYLGDGLLVYFGYPVAHEDDAVRAVRVGLRIIEAMQALNPHQSRLLQVRIGIHTGLVVVGEMGGGSRQEQLALGETPNIAARVQGTANPNEVVISAATYRLVEGLFACEDHGQPALKGVTTPLTLYRVVKESEAQSRFEVAVQAGLTPLVGREEELALLRRRWEQATDGEGQVVLLSGEAGIGKSRLVQELKDHVAQDSAVRIEFRCSPYHQNSAFYPLIEHVQQVLHFAPSDTPQAKVQKLEHTLARYRFPQSDTVPLLAALLSLPHPEAVSPLTWTPQQQKQKTLDALLQWLFEEAERAAVYTVWEDLHWADPSTLEFLGLCLDQVPTTRMLLLLTFRPEFTPTWASRSHVSHLVLSRLGRKQTSVIVEQLTGRTALPSEVLRQIVAKTDGVPLFVEELTKSVVETLREQGTGDGGQEHGKIGAAQRGAPVPALGVPATLQDALMARLDRLGTAKEVAQQGAVVGRELTYEVLRTISPLTEAALQQELTKLVEAELLYQRGRPPQATYLFKHALVQETAYQSLLKSKRQQYHRQIAEVFEARFSETTATQPELVAHHYTQAGLIEQAIPHWQRTGERAVQRSAHIEAINYLTKGLELLQAMPDIPERIQQELILQVLLGGSLMAVKGFASSEMENAYLRAQELCKQQGDSTHLFPALFGLWVFYLARARLQMAREFAMRLLRTAQSMQDSTLLLVAHHALGMTLFFLGEFFRCREYAERGITLYDIQQHRSLAFLYASSDPGVFCQGSAARTLWNLGYPDQALKMAYNALTLAKELAHPYNLASAIHFTAGLHQFRKEEQAVQEQADRLMALSSDQGFPFFLVSGCIYQGWSLAIRGRGEEGLTLMHRGLSEWRAMQAELWQPYFLALVAETYGMMQRVDEGLSMVVEALAVADKTGECFYEAELYRLKGALTLQSKSSPREVTGKSQTSLEAEAEECFWKAIEIARHQQAKSLELRTVMSLSQLWQQQGKQKEAHELLSEIYGWFTEGFDTKDLQEAKALLEKLLTT
jgi:class 3 adenylate cyclase/predicted ATPase